MSGPPDGGSGHVPVSNGPSLREYLEHRFAEHAIAHQEHQVAHRDEHRASQLAIDTAAELARENKAAANEWRSAMADRERSFARLDVVESLSRRFELVERESRDRTVRDAERDRGIVRMIAIAAVMAGVGSFVLNIIVRVP